MTIGRPYEQSTPHIFRARFTTLAGIAVISLLEKVGVFFGFHLGGPRHWAGFSFVSIGHDFLIKVRFEIPDTAAKNNAVRSGSTPAHDWARYPFRIASIIERMRGVVIERRPALQVMRTHDGGDTLHYVDPPYLPVTRGRKNFHDAKHQYRYEMTIADHEELLGALRDLTGMVGLSGYPAQLYDDVLFDWIRVERQALADGARPRIEVLWINPLCAERHEAEIAPLFGEFA
jgi:hypothetical protein